MLPLRLSAVVFAVDGGFAEAAVLHAICIVVEQTIPFILRKCQSAIEGKVQWSI